MNEAEKQVEQTYYSLKNGKIGYTCVVVLFNTDQYNNSYKQFV